VAEQRAVRFALWDDGLRLWLTCGLDLEPVVQP
jgi:hypothetical protein